MNWRSETAVLWLPKDHNAYPADFATRAEPGSSDFFYYALDAFAAIFERTGLEFDKEPWAYVLEDQIMLSPAEIETLKSEWQAESKLASEVQVVAAQ